jgi:hypothetical protein
MDAADANAHIAYSVVLLQMNHFSDAKREAEAGVKADPKSQQAHELWSRYPARETDDFGLESE